jgi:glycosyltransferase involved in cell wall biosynthesis
VPQKILEVKEKKLHKVLMIFSSNYNGHHARDLAYGFYEAGVDTGFISLSNPQIPSWIDSGYGEDFSEMFKSKKSIFQKISITLGICRRFKPDIIQTHLFIGGIVGLFVGKFLSIPVVHTRHHIDEHYQSGTFLHRWIDRVVAKKSNHVIVCSYAAKNWLIQIEGVKESHITVINQGFNFDFLNPSTDAIEKARLDLGFSEEKLEIVCVSRYSKAKGQNYLLEALKELVKTIPNISLTLMGPGDSDWIVQLVDELGLAKHVQILPSRNDVPACIAAADMVIHPSLADSFSQLIIEAQGVGGLLIATDIAAAREQLIDGVTGLIVPPRDSIAIAKAVRYLVQNPELANSIRKNGPPHVRESFTWQRMVSEEIACLAKFIQPH